MLNYLNKIFNQKTVVFFIGFIFTFLFSFQAALAKEYSYDSIKVNIKINADSTFNVEEQQTFNYIGEYHVGWRSVSLNKTDGISDIKIVDGETGQPLVYSSKRLDKLNSANWGKFTYFKENGAENIEWYYNLADTAYKWVIKYKVHGGIGFFPNYDELYWNVFTDYEVPIKEVAVSVSLPEEVNYRNITYKSYRTDQRADYFTDKSPLPDKKSYLFEAKNFKHKEDFTIQISWPKGVVSRSAYWMDFIKIYLFYLLAGLITLANPIFIFIHWYWREIKPVGRGTIIPQYAPPENLRPAMAEVLLKEKVTDKGWSATVIDLAVRGYIRIKEDTTDWTEIVGRIGALIFFLFFAFIFLLPLLDSNNLFEAISKIPFLIIIFFVLFLVSPFVAIFLNIFKTKNGKDFFAPKNYILEKNSVSEDKSSELEDYETVFLDILFRDGNGYIFSTKEMKKASNYRKRELYRSMKNLEEGLYKETTVDTGAFETGVEKEKTGTVILAAAIFLVVFIFVFFQVTALGFAVFISAILLNAVTLYVYLNYEAYLSKKGLILKEDWLGFKMYLETAERYRMQNLTPETFEKYLPYAIIFGIEEKWGRAFESMNIQNPSWYSGAYVGSSFHSSGFSGSAGFSPAGFSASFSSSFSSAFSSAGGAGSAGGGGGGEAGGGGGGGGGAG